jgi:two-component system, chemotaxis family, protein-glutamate methylesterase/glutaminase
MPVQEARAGLAVEPNHIYVVPHGSELNLEDERFCLRPRSKPHGWPNIITLFLDSLTKCRKPPGVAVILSGLDCDGSAALRKFQSQGGITIAQDPDTADYAEMPRAAINTGSIDYVLTPEAIVGKLEAIGQEFGARVGVSELLLADRDSAVVAVSR